MDISLVDDLRIEHLPVGVLKPYPRNARVHSRKQVRQIARSIERFGFVNPVLVDDEEGIIAGHGRVEAAKLLGRMSVPCLRVRHLSEKDKRAYILADNRLAEKAGWDRELLALEIEELVALDSEIVEIAGFAIAEIDTILEEAGEAKGKVAASPDDVLPDVKTEAVSRAGDLWLLGNHRLCCNNALEGESFAVLMGNERAEMVFTDPPYNVPIEGHVSGLGKTRHGEFAFASGEMSRAEFIAFLEKALGNAASVSIDGSIHFVCMDWRHIEELMAAGRKVYSELKNLCVWAKDNGGMGSFYRSRHELVFVWKNGNAPHLNTFELGQHGRYRTNVWEYAGVNTLRKGRAEELAMHPTVKPVAMIVDAIKDVSRHGGIVLDPFGGSGSTLIAAEKTGRRARLIEYEPRYCDVILRRWQAYTGRNAILAETGESFELVEEMRRGGGAAISTGISDVNADERRCA